MVKLRTIKIKPQKLELWRRVVGYEDSHEVSNLGRVRTIDRFVEYKNGNKVFCKGRILSIRDNGHGYMNVQLNRNGKRKVVYVHRLVAEAFIPNPENKPEVNHIDENKQNNNVNNLEWVTRRENELHGTKQQRGHASQVIPIYGVNIITGERVDFPSMREAQRAGFNRGGIRNCIEGKSKQSKGYKWYLV